MVVTWTSPRSSATAVGPEPMNPVMTFILVPRISLRRIGWIDVVERRADAPAKVSLAFRSSMVFTPVVCQLTSTRPKSLIRPRKRNWAVKFNPAQFRFLGRMSDFGRVLVSWHTTGVKTIDDLKAKETFAGASSRRSTTSIQPVLINEILGARMKVITGFMGSGPTAVALERGEVQVTTIAYSTLVSLHPDWLRDKKVNIIAGLDFTDVPGVTKIRDMIGDP